MNGILKQGQIYGWIENILKRINRFYNITLPTGGTWHIDLK